MVTDVLWPDNKSLQYRTAVVYFHKINTLSGQKQSSIDKVYIKLRTLAVKSRKRSQYSGV